MAGFDKLIALFQRVLITYENEQDLPIEDRYYTTTSLESCITSMHKNKVIKREDVTALFNYLNLTKHADNITWRFGDSESAIRWLKHHIGWLQSFAFYDKTIH